MIDVASEQPNALGCGGRVHLGFLVGIFRGFQILLRGRAMRKQELGAVQLPLRQHFIGGKLLVVGEGGGQVGTADRQQRLTFLDLIAEASLDFDHAPAAHGDYRHGAADVGCNRPCHVQLILHLLIADRDELEVRGILNLHHIGVGSFLHLHLRLIDNGGLGDGIAGMASRESRAQNHNQN